MYSNKTHGIMNVNEWNVITHSVCAEKERINKAPGKIKNCERNGK